MNRKLLAPVAALAALVAATWPAAAQNDDRSAFEQLAAFLHAQLASGRTTLESSFGQLEPALAVMAAPAVAALITSSRDDALRRGTLPVPDEIRREIGDYVPGEVLDAVRWCTACGGELSLQKATFRLGLAPAITLDHVIVFAEHDAAMTDAALWIHELKHVMQFREWGVDGFAVRYVEDYEAVEREAAHFRWEWVQSNDWLERRGFARR